LKPGQPAPADLHPNREVKTNMTHHSYRCLPILAMALVVGLTGCASHQNPEEVKEKTAQATAELKSDAKAVAEGVREGWSRDKPLNINTASREDLVSLPGVTEAEADKVVARRPYDDPHELVTRGALPKSKYDRIADRLTATNHK
jgi:DNA uptake protein ComE-like DNA-binding protein